MRLELPVTDWLVRSLLGGEILRQDEVRFFQVTASIIFLTPMSSFSAPAKS